MAAETAPIRAKTRRAKDLALDRAVEILENPAGYDQELYKATFLTVLKNAVPRAQEVSGEDGAPISFQITGMKIIKDAASGDRVSDQESQTA